jgi:uncharacterized membrane protein
MSHSAAAEQRPAGVTQTLVAASREEMTGDQVSSRLRVQLLRLGWLAAVAAAVLTTLWVVALIAWRDWTSSSKTACDGSNNPKVQRR